jgi:hypothetical protein
MRINNLFQRLFWGKPSTAMKRQVGRWRLVPQCLDEVWRRAALIAFPADETLPRQLLRKYYDESDIQLSRLTRNEMQSPGDFSGLREFQPGDDLRNLDWRATARSGRPIVRTWAGESRSGVVVVVDVSASMYYSDLPEGIRPIDMAFEMGLLIAAAALSRQQSISIQLVSEVVEWQSGPLSGRQCLNGLIDFLSTFQPSSSKTEWSEFVINSSASGDWIFLISDFLWLPEPEAFFEKSVRFRSYGLKIQADRFIANDLNDYVDIETGTKLTVYPSQSRIDQRMKEWSALALMPILPISIDEKQPEIQLATWLRGKMQEMVN